MWERGIGLCELGDPALQVKLDTFMQYVQPRWERLHRIAGRYAIATGDAHDLVQETLCRAWRNYSSTKEAEYSPAWLFVIMRNVVVEWQRTAQRRISMVPLPTGELTEFAAADLTESLASFPSLNEERFCELLDDRIVQAMDTLDPTFREVLMLSVAGGLTYRDIAEVVGCPVGTVMSRMARARRSLREKLAEFAHRSGWVKEPRP